MDPSGHIWNFKVQLKLYISILFNHRLIVNSLSIMLLLSLVFRSNPFQVRIWVIGQCLSMNKKHRLSIYVVGWLVGWLVDKLFGPPLLSRSLTIEEIWAELQGPILKCLRSFQWPTTADSSGFRDNFPNKFMVSSIQYGINFCKLLSYLEQNRWLSRVCSRAWLLWVRVASPGSPSHPNIINFWHRITKMVMAIMPNSRL